MKLIEQIDRHEVLRKWAIGEVYSQFFKPKNNSDRTTIMALLLSGNRDSEQYGISTVLEIKQGLVDSISIHIRWFRALLEISKRDLDLIYTLQLPGWKKNTGGSFLLSDAARNIQKWPDLDHRVLSIQGALECKRVNLAGITLLAVDKIGPYVVVEGTGRLTSLYIIQHLNGVDVFPTKQIEITLGLY